MINLDPAFNESISSSSLTLCWCWQITRIDGAMIGFTSLDLDIEIDGLTYRGITGFDPTASQTSSGLSKLDSQNLKGILDVSGISRSDIESGLYDGAEIRKFLVDYTNLPTSLNEDPPRFREFPSCFIASKKFSNLGYELKTKDDAERLEWSVGTTTSKSCRATRLGDDRCRKDLTNFTHQLTVTSVSNRSSFTVDETQPDNYFSWGYCTFTSGENDGFVVGILTQQGDRLTLNLSAPKAIAVGDTLTAVAGCDRTEKTCVTKFANFYNYVGEPRTPNLDTYLNSP